MLGSKVSSFLFSSWWLMLAGCCPIISNFSPEAGEVGTEVTIEGNKFEDSAEENTVKFNGVTVPLSDISFASTTEIKAKVPAGAATGLISVKNRYCTGYSKKNFVVSQNLWSNDPSVNTAISTSPRDQLNPAMTSDGSGGAIIAWYDWRGGTPRVYVQRISSLGAVEWVENGVALCTALSNQAHPKITSDGSGGAIITWHDQRGSNNEVGIRAQRVNSLGVIQWSVDGVPICTETGVQEFPSIVSDGFGGAIITWIDKRAGSSNVDIYAQRINSAGVVQWTANGVPICRASGSQWNPAIVSDNAGGAIIAWYDKRSGYFDIYAQRISATGAAQWTSNGVSICTAPGDQMRPNIVTDGGGGAIITWDDKRAGSLDSNIYVQRVNSSGVVQWNANGVLICSAAYHQTMPVGISDGSGGATVAWIDGRNGDSDIYAQRISAAGAAQWTSNGVAICAAQRRQSWGSGLIPTRKIVGDGIGGAIITWQDGRDSGDDNIYAQRINASGTVQWAEDGVAVCTAANGQSYPALVSGAGGVIISWQDYRSGSSIDIYAQRVTKEGNL